LPAFRQLTAAFGARGGRHSHRTLFVGRRLIGSPRPCAHRADAAAADRTQAQPIRSCVMLTNIALWFILLGLLALVPIGCIMTRRPKPGDTL
jgi:hypothetical protein